MISRVADHCFWLGRYLERAEATVRVLMATRTLALDAELAARQCWLPVLHALGEEPAFTERFGPEAAADDDVVEQFMTWDDENVASIVRSASAMRENARSVRDVVSLEAWEAMNELYLYVASDRAREEWALHRLGFYHHVRHATQLALGLMRSTMLHDRGLDFIWLGVMLERGGQTARILDVHHHAAITLRAAGGGSPVLESAHWVATLHACSAYEPFMKEARGRITGPSVAAFLLAEARFPRSVRYCVRTAHQRLADIRPPEQHDLPGGQTLERMRVLAEWVEQQCRTGVEPGAVHDVLTHVVDEIAEVCHGLGREIFGFGGARS